MSYSPNNKHHQHAFLALYIELKWAEDQFLPSLAPVAEKRGSTRRTLQTIRAKMRRLGLIDHMSRFNQKHGYKEGWILSRRFSTSMSRLSILHQDHKRLTSPLQEAKDRHLISLI